MKQFNLLLLIACFFSLSSQAQSVPAYVPTNGLVGWWPFNGNANDESGNGNNGTVNGATLTSDRNGNGNSAYSFDGINDLIRIPHQNQLNLMGNFTASIWFNISAIPTSNNNHVFMAKRDDNGTCCSSNVPFDFYITYQFSWAPAHFKKPGCGFANNGNYNFSESDSVITINTWNNIVFTYSFDTLKIFLNNILINDDYFPNSNRAANLSDLLMGSVNREFGAEWMNGVLDDIGIWNRALTQQEITDLYQAQTCSLSISSQPSNSNTTPGSNATFTTGVTTTCSSPISYQWQTNLGFGWQNLQNAGQYTGVNTTSLQVSNVSGSNTNQQFRCLVSTGNISDTSQTANINIVSNSNVSNSGITHAIPYQAAVRDGSGNLLNNHPLLVRCSLHENTASGTILYQETHNITTNNLGLFTLQIGTGTAVVGNMDSINWALYKKFVQIEIDTTAQGSSYTDLGTQQLMAVPYALYAETAGKALSAPKGDNGVAGANGINGSNGTNGLNGADGVSVTSANITNDSLYLSLSNNQTLNAGKITQGNTPAAYTGTVTNILPNSVKIIGNSCINSGGTFVAKGICYSTYPNPTIDSMKSSVNFFDGTYSVDLLNLNTNTTYYYRAFAVNHLGISYGNELVFTTSNLATIGDSYQGGIVAYILQPGDPGYDPNIQHGLIAAPYDQSTGIQWYNGGYVTTGATGTAIGTGNANTNTIEYVQGAGSYAAKLCYDLVLNGYSDWYLPSKDELNKLYLNKTAIGGFAAATAYWSSSETDNFYAWVQSFPNGSQYNDYKYTTYAVRAVRAF